MRRRFWREGPLKDTKELEGWLRKQPREVSAAFAARAALRALPSVWTAREEGFKGDFFTDVVLPVFRASAVAWVTARYPGQQMELLRANAAGAAAVAAASATRDAAVAAARRAADEAADAAAFAAVTYTRAAAADACWDAVSFDATRVEEGAAASAISGSPLWQRERLIPALFWARFRAGPHSRCDASE